MFTFKQSWSSKNNAGIRRSECQVWGPSRSTWDPGRAASDVERRSLEGVDDIVLCDARQIIFIKEGALKSCGVNLCQDHLEINKQTQTNLLPNAASFWSIARVKLTLRKTPQLRTFICHHLVKKGKKPKQKRERLKWNNLTNGKLVVDLNATSCLAFFSAQHCFCVSKVLNSGT